MPGMSGGLQPALCSLPKLQHDTLSFSSPLASGSLRTRPPRLSTARGLGVAPLDVVEVLLDLVAMAVRPSLVVLGANDSFLDCLSLHNLRWEACNDCAIVIACLFAIFTLLGVVEPADSGDHDAWYDFACGRGDVPRQGRVVCRLASFYVEVQRHASGLDWVVLPDDFYAVGLFLGSCLLGWAPARPRSRSGGPVWRRRP